MNRRALLNALVAGLAIPLAPIRLAEAAIDSGAAVGKLEALAAYTKENG